jgi:hypothetical protein
MRRNSQRLVCPKCRKHHHPRKTGREQTARFCQAVPRGDIRPTCVSARCGWLPRAAISTSREWAAIGEVAPLLLAAGTPKAPHLRIHTINTNRLTALIPRLSSGIVRRPATCDRRVRSALRIHPITPATYLLDTAGRSSTVCAADGSTASQTCRFRAETMSMASRRTLNWRSTAASAATGKVADETFWR